MPTPVVPPHFGEERLEVAAATLLARQEQSGPGSQVHGPEDGAPRIAATQPHPGDLAALRPRGPQGWEQQQVGLVLGQDHAPPRQGPDLPADPPFVSRARGPVPGRDAAASGGIPSGAAPGAGSPGTPAAPWRSPGVLGAGATS